MRDHYSIDFKDCDKPSAGTLEYIKFGVVGLCADHYDECDKRRKWAQKAVKAWQLKSFFSIP